MFRACKSTNNSQTPPLSPPSRTMDQSTLQGLLERLRSSTAYTNTLAGTHAPEHSNSSGSSPLPPALSSHEPQPHANLDAQTDSPGVSSRISSLLSRLRPPTTQGPDVELPVSQVPEIKTMDHASENMVLDSISDNESLGITQHVPKVDYRSLTYVESLSRVEELLRDPRAADALLELKRTQDEMEKKLWDGRKALRRKHEEKVHAAKTTARIVTGSEQLDEKEIQRLLDELKRAELEYDLKHILPAWDALVHKQQTVMESLGVPAMLPSTDPTERARQQRIIRVMEQGLMEES
ncbi:hypothetical protein FS837_010786 [Tulasnella sp. UAMH 9824]|nr:hypothetical protein FS837_010786 [Tulasnella sp. UAMH 9824]